MAGWSGLVWCVLPASSIVALSFSLSDLSVSPQSLLLSLGHFSLHGDMFPQNSNFSVFLQQTKLVISEAIPQLQLTSAMSFCNSSFSFSSFFNLDSCSSFFFSSSSSLSLGSWPGCWMMKTTCGVFGYIRSDKIRPQHFSPSERRPGPWRGSSRRRWRGRQKQRWHFPDRR